MPRTIRLLVGLASVVAALLACGPSEEPRPPAPSAPAAQSAAPPAAGQAPSARATAPAGGLAAAPPAPADLPRGLLVAVSRFERDQAGKILPRSELLMLARRGGQWQASRHEDPESNVFNKAMPYDPPLGSPGILTLGGMEAKVKLWRVGDTGLEAETLWAERWGEKNSRMRDVEQGDLYGVGLPDLAVATHDQGVVAVLRPRETGGVEVVELDRQADTIVHEVEIGDLDGDGTPEVYATPSEPNRLDGTPQPGHVVRYVPARGEGRQVVADLGQRHAKEILAGDVDGDGRDELYVSVEAVEGGTVEIRRYDAGTPPGAGSVVATLEDAMCRFLTAGDVDGDGRREMVAAAKETGVWLLRPNQDPRSRWSSVLVDPDSRGFEHAALLTDLDGDGRDELYVASDDDLEIRRYVWVDGAPTREAIHRRTGTTPILTWNIMAAPAELIPAE
jgi:hypothetical protein